MKKLTIIILFFSCISLNAQNTLFVSFQPCDMGIGLRYDYQPKQLGLYTSANYGNYRLGERYINDHVKSSLGILFENYSIGINYHQFGKVVGEYSKNTLDPISFELGLKASINRFCAGIRFDPVKFEGTWDFGFNF